MTGAAWSACVAAALSKVGGVVGGVVVSLLLYRILFHPLNRFPGPWAARVSDLWLSIQLGRHDMHTQSVRLHQQHGDFVRIGSSTLMIAHPLAVAAIHGPDSACRKAAMYDFEQPNRGIATRDGRLHAARRRLWSRGFGDKALRGYETRIAVYVDMVLERLAGASAAGTSVSVVRLTEHFAFDVMGDLGLGQDFGMLQHDRQHPAVEQLVQGMAIMGLRLPMWLMRLIIDVAQSLVPTEASTGFLTFCYTHLERLMADEGRFNRPSLMAPLLAHYEQQSPAERDLSALRNDCRFIVIAGSDTVAATLAFLFFYLARHPNHVAKLRAELLPFRRPDSTFAHQDIANAVHLNALISETLRLHPPASTLMRTTPPEGIRVADTYIPGDMTVFSSQFVIGRSEAVYQHAAQFCPERWYSQPELIKHPAGYAPFSIGSHSCLGRPLALMEMRLLIAACVSSYDVTFTPAFDPTVFLNSVQDCMSWHLGKLDLRFTKRV
ncbi:cytochrome P450 [Dothidotthia symphoricarpi CBS 119687]|uniref:Cytochrome P450 n=1 Tax=Dothidotthia symphoricarpi CBS 119687 TaxID=1392245 RepID=A0A6A6ADW6_9PLEO|nr:cytochrome P450 [Dothidotthia symphoricarpi CBS 119687]KAF2129144.1 cytochrome P450 [Dothidotthia symphoricarpi CBS 119687]